jgi:hypothetical protein
MQAKTKILRKFMKALALIAVIIYSIIAQNTEDGASDKSLRPSKCSSAIFLEICNVAIQ